MLSERRLIALKTRRGWGSVMKSDKQKVSESLCSFHFKDWTCCSAVCEHRLTPECSHNQKHTFAGTTEDCLISLSCDNRSDESGALENSCSNKDC